MSSKWFVAWIVVFTVTTGFSLNELRNQARSGHEARVALCAFKQDLNVRVSSSVSYLNAHPDGLPGIPASVIRDSISNQQKTLRSLTALHCALEAGS